MDFNPGEAEAEVSRLAAQVLSAGAGTAASTDLDTALWKELAGTGLLSLALPVELGGDGLGVQAVAALLTEVGKHAARIPALATLSLGVLPVARTSGDVVREELLAGVSSGDTILTAAFREPSQPMPAAPSTGFDSAYLTVTGVKVGVPYAAAAVTLQTVGPTLTAHGTQHQKDFFLPKILAGEVHCAIGYTEPGSGTDLASLITGAVLDGDSYIVTGQKIFTIGAHDADYVWLACRTDQDAPRHKGLSILIVDTSDPGYSWTPIITHDGAHHVNVTYYSDVRVPVTIRVGAQNDGWRLITSQLNHERVMLGPAGRLGALHDRVRSWAASHPGPDGRPLLELPDVRRALASAAVAERVNELLNWQVAADDTVNVADAPVTKVFGSEQTQRAGQELAEIVSRHGDLADEQTAGLARWLDVQNKRNTVLTFGGGVNEVQRELIATAGLKLPRVPR
jgi:3-oxo-4-pregnene-20-carboxyl-CoA dehydrogenase beta subunit